MKHVMSRRLRTAAVLILLTATPAFAQMEDYTQDGTVTAVQERMFVLKHELSFGVGLVPLDAFFKGVSVQLGYTYHINEWFSWQVGRGFFSYNLPTSLQKSLEEEWGATPRDFRRVEFSVGSDAIIRPIYAKGALFNSALLWFEVYALGGASIFKFSTGFAPAVNFGAGFRLFQSQALSFKVEAVDHLALAGGLTHVGVFQLVLGVNFGGR
jgi:outer membrane beta-barrel protein